MPSDNQEVITASDLTEAQLASASEFLAANDWPENESARTITRSEIAKLIAWYGALRFMSGAKGIGTLEKPPRLIQSNRRRTPPKETEPTNEFELLELVDVTFRTMG